VNLSVSLGAGDVSSLDRAPIEGLPNDVAINESEITVRFHRRAHLPIVLIDKPVAVPWWNRRAIRLIQ
jgi:hypothetical protein